MNEAEDDPERAEAARALAELTGAPAWLCRLALEESFDHHDEALRLVRAVPASVSRDFGRGFLRARAAMAAAGTPKQRVAASAEQAADEHIASGELVWLGGGLMHSVWLACPRCLVSRPHRAGGSPPSRCARCAGPLIRIVSMGCELGDEEEVYGSAFNDRIVAHVRRALNPAFRWADLRRQEG